MDVALIKIKVYNLIVSGQEDYYIKMITCYLDLINEVRKETGDYAKNCIDEYEEIILFFWELREKSLNEN